MDVVSLLIFIAVIAVIIVAVVAILQRVPLDPAMRNIILIAGIALIAVFCIAALVSARHGGGLFIGAP